MIYNGQDGGWASTPAYVSAQPDPSDQSFETLPIYPDGGLADAGTYLVNVAYSKTHCEPDAGGCVQASTVAAATMTRP